MGSGGSKRAGKTEPIVVDWPPKEKKPKQDAPAVEMVSTTQSKPRDPQKEENNAQQQVTSPYEKASCSIDTIPSQEEEGGIEKEQQEAKEMEMEEERGVGEGAKGHSAASVFAPGCTDNNNKSSKRVSLFSVGEGRERNFGRVDASGSELLISASCNDDNGNNNSHHRHHHGVTEAKEGGGPGSVDLNNNNNSGGGNNKGSLSSSSTTTTSSPNNANNNKAMVVVVDTKTKGRSGVEERVEEDENEDETNGEDYNNLQPFVPHGGGGGGKSSSTALKSPVESYLRNYDAELSSFRSLWKGDRKKRYSQYSSISHSSGSSNHLPVPLPLGSVDDLRKLVSSLSSNKLNRFLFDIRNFVVQMPNVIECCILERNRRLLVKVCKILTINDIEFAGTIIGHFLEDLGSCEEDGGGGGNSGNGGTKCDGYDSADPCLKDKLIALGIEITDVLFEAGHCNHLEAVLNELSRHAVTLDDLDEQKEATLEINVRLCRAYLLTGKLELSQATMEMALPLVEAAHGSTSMKVAEILYMAGDVCFRRGLYNKCEEYIKRALDICHGVKHAEKNIDFVRVVKTIGQLYIARNRFSDAEQSLNIALDLAKSNFGVTHPVYGDVLLSFSEYYEKVDMLEKALEVAEEAKDIFTLNFGEWASLDTATALERISYILYLQNFSDSTAFQNEDSDRALKLIRQALNIKLDIFGGDGEVVKSFKRLSSNARKKGKHLEVNDMSLSYSKMVMALIFLQNSIRLKRTIRKRLGISDIDNKSDKLLVKKMQWRLLRHSEKLMEQSLTISTKHYGYEHPFTAWCLRSTGKLYQTMRDFKKAEDFFVKSLKITMGFQERENRELTLTCETPLSQMLSRDSSQTFIDSGTFVAAAAAQQISAMGNSTNNSSNASYGTGQLVVIPGGLGSSSSNNNSNSNSNASSSRTSPAFLSNQDVVRHLVQQSTCQDMAAASSFSALGGLYHYDMENHNLAIDCLNKAIDLTVEIVGKYSRSLESDFIALSSAYFALGDDVKGRKYKEKCRKWNEERKRFLKNTYGRYCDDSDTQSIELTMASIHL
eukprot:Nk52_evm13s307 gene=Nk52_evmTU13s307